MCGMADACCTCLLPLQSLAAAANSATLATVAAAQATVAAAAPAPVAVPGLSRAVAMSPAVANRFELAKELTIQVGYSRCDDAVE